MNAKRGSTDQTESDLKPPLCSYNKVSMHGITYTNISFPETTSFSVGNWWWIVSVGVAIGGACILVVIRVRFGRRHRPVQDASVSSTTTDREQETIRLEEIPRSPRRRM